MKPPRLLFAATALFLMTSVAMAADASDDPRLFFDTMDQAEKQLTGGNTREAIRSLETALTHARLNAQKSMVYRKLAQVHRDDGNLELELQYVREVQRRTPHPEILERYRRREYEILIARSQSQGLENPLSGRDWVQMPDDEKAAMIRAAVEIFSRLDIPLARTEAEYVRLLEAYLSEHLELSSGDLADVFASMVYESEPEIREAMDRL